MYHYGTKDFLKMLMSSTFLASLIHERSEVNDEMAKDEARHGCAFQGLLKRYFK